MGAYLMFMDAFYKIFEYLLRFVGVCLRFMDGFSMFSMTVQVDINANRNGQSTMTRNDSKVAKTFLVNLVDLSTKV